MDVSCYCKMTLFIALDGVTSLKLRLKYVVNICTRVRRSLAIGGHSLNGALAESWKKLKTSNVFSSFIVCWNRNRSALVRDLLCNNSLIVCQLYEDKSLALRARDLIFLTTDLQTVVMFLCQVFECCFNLTPSCKMNSPIISNGRVFNSILGLSGDFLIPFNSQ